MANKQKLELTWIGKYNRPKLEPRILLEDPSGSHAAAQRVTENDSFDNRLIFGDNLLALRALEQEYTGKVKCAYIDPPYNTGSAFDHYEDGVEHSTWLSLMRDRLEILCRLLSPDGSVWISLDDNEVHYFKVMMDEVFGRQNFVASIVWQKIFSVKNSARHFSDMHDYIVVYAKDASRWERNLLPRSSELDATYSNPDSDPRGPWTTNAIQARNFYSLGEYEIRSPRGKSHRPPKGTYWRVSSATFETLNAENRVWWGKDGTSIPRIKKFLSEAKQGVVPATMWFHQDCGTNAEAKTELRALLAEELDADLFITPKPERLIKRVLELATKPGDLVLDSFAGSGTTGAVAQKMGRRWIMVELGEHCHTQIMPRLRKVIDGKDLGGITEALNWKGGGGFRYFTLAPSLLETDQWGQWVISKEFNAEMLSEAVCKLEGFTYAPSETFYWQQGYSTERDFIYVTTQQLTTEQLTALSDEVGSERSLLVLCASFRAPKNADQLFPNLTIRKIPKQVLSRCEWGHDDYSLKVENLPKAPPPPMPVADKKGQASLFDADVLT